MDHNHNGPQWLTMTDDKDKYLLRLVEGLTLTHWVLVQISKLALLVPAVSVRPQLFLAQRPSKLALFVLALSIPPRWHCTFQSQHVALMGNQKQLRTVIESQEVQALGLWMSIFERLTKESIADIVVSDGWCWYTSAVPFAMLDPAISCFQLHQFYNRALQDGFTDVFGSTIPRLLAPDPHYVWSHMEPGASPSIVFQDHASDKSMKDWSQWYGWKHFNCRKSDFCNFN